MNIPDDLSSEDRVIWERYRGFCVSCLGEGQVIHEEPPRSCAPQRQDDRYLLCAGCHTPIQKMPRADAKEYLEYKREIFQALFN